MSFTTDSGEEAVPLFAALHCHIEEEEEEQQKRLVFEINFSLHINSKVQNGSLVSSLSTKRINILLYLTLLLPYHDQLKQDGASPQLTSA